MAGYLHQTRRMNSRPSLSLLHVAAPAAAGGLESVVRELSVGLAARGHRVALLAVMDAGAPPPPLLGSVAAQGVSVVPVSLRARAYLQEGRAVRRTIAEFLPDVVHTHGYRPDLIGGRVAVQERVPWITTFHGFTGGGPKNRTYEWAQRRQARRATRAIAVSEGIRARLLDSGLSPARIELLPNAWSARPVLGREAARARLGIEGTPPIIGWVGRLSPEKGADLFLMALSLMRSAAWHAAVVGEGPEGERLRRLASRLGIGDRVAWLGMVPEAHQLFPAFDAWVLSSRTEGTPMTLFEAMAAGVPIVATAVGGVPDVVSGDEACLVPAEDPAALAGALAGLLANPAATSRRRDAARARLEAAFGIEPWLDAHEALYRACAAGRPDKR